MNRYILAVFILIAFACKKQNESEEFNNNQPPILEDPSFHCKLIERYTELDYFTATNIEVIKDLKYGTTKSENEEFEDLLLDFYYPNIVIDTIPQRPFILLIHGGGFIFGNKSLQALECKELAKRGFACASINYRLTSQPTDEAIYRAQQDVNAALRYASHRAVDLKLDTNWFFIGGRSSGSISAFSTAFMSEEDWEDRVPGITDSLGGLDESGNNFTSNYKIRGIYNNAGMALTKYISKEELVGHIGFHGELDQIVDIDVNKNGYSGSRVIHSLFDFTNNCSQLIVDPEGSHVIYNDSLGKKFIASKVSCFFKSLICETCQSYYTTDPEEAALCSN